MISDGDIKKARENIAETIGRYLPLTPKGSEFNACCPFHDEKTPSFTINDNDGFFHCFGCGANGDAIAFVMQHQNIPFADAVAEIIGNVTGDNQPIKKQMQRTKKQEWIAQPVAPSGSVPNFTHYKHGQPVEIYHYTDSKGQTIGYTCRFDTPAGKEVLPMTWATQSDTGAAEWRWLGMAKKRPLYGLLSLALRKKAPVLIVEGEKTANAAQKLLPQYSVISWCGGANGIKNTDWQPLHGRSVTLWPDGDAIGIKAMRDIMDALNDDTVLFVPAPFTDGWDLADDAPDSEWSAGDYLYSNIINAHEYFNQPANPDVILAGESDNRIALTLESAVWYKRLPEYNEKSGKPLATIENLDEFCQRLGVTIRYNVIKKEDEIIVPDVSMTVDNRSAAALAWLYSACVRIEMPTTNLMQYVTYIADQNLFNPAAEWITSKPWDGISRLGDLYNTVTTEPDKTALKNALMRRWLTSAVAAAFMPNGVSAHGILVFQGAQYLGKTAWFKSLVPDHLDIIKDGVQLNPANVDSVKQAVSNWIVELGELDSTFKRSDLSQLKAFVTRDKDILRRPYAKAESQFARRTVFFGSVNPEQFLHDTTGNRRYWTIAATGIDSQHGIDMQQLWREVYDTIFLAWNHDRKAIPWMLSPDEHEALNASNADFESADPIYETLLDMYDWGTDQTFWDWKSATQVLTEMGFQNHKKSETTLCGGYITKLNNGVKKKSNGKRLMLVPMIKKGSPV